jgi:hypothetical protein
MYIAEQLHKSALVRLCINDKFTLMHGVEHKVKQVFFLSL